MDNVIQCPTCSKKYRLAGTPPATFECRNCGTVMDLSAFAQPAAPPPAQLAQPAGRAAAPARGGVPQRRGARSRSAARGRRGRRRDYDDDHGYDDEDGHPHYHSRGPNQTLVFGSAIVVVIALAAFIFWVSRDKPKPPEEPKKVAKTPVYVPTPDEPEEEVVVKKRTPKVEKGREDEKRPELREGRLDNVPIPEGKQKYRVGQADIKTYPWPEYVTAEERNEIEEAVSNLELGGIDAQDAERYLVQLDARSDDGKLKPGEEFKGVGRVVSEFKNILDEYNGEVSDRLCLARLMQLDRILRAIDGMPQRDFGDREGIRSQSLDRHVKLVIKRWNWWYDLEKWHMRREPWDQTLDLEDPEAMEGEDFEDEEELPDD